MQRISFSLFIILSLLASSTLAQVQYAVVVLDGNGTQIDVARSNTGSLSMNLATTARTVLIFGGSVAPNNVRLFDISKDIGSISLSGGPGAGLSLNVVIGASFSPSSDAGTVAAQNCAGIDISGVLNANSTFSGRIGGNLTGAIRGVRQLYRFDVDGTMTAGSSVRAGGPGSGGLAIVQAGTIAAGSTVGIDSGMLFRVQTIGNMSGSIFAGNTNVTPPTSGNIGSIIVGGNISATSTIAVTNGTLDTLTVTGDIDLPVPEDSNPENFTPRIYASNGIGAISARSIKGVISTVYNGTNNGGNGTIGSLTTTRDTNGTGGFFRGSLISQGFANVSGSNPSINIDGDFGGVTPARVSLRGSAIANKPIMIRGRLSSGSILFIGNSLPASVTIGGNPGYTTGRELQGQILVSARSFPNETTGTWTGSVRIGGSSGPNVVVLGPTIPNYANTTASIGGGSIGVFPYRLHDSACDPPNSSTLPPTSVIDPALPRPDMRVFLSSELAHTPGTDPSHPVIPRNIALEWYGPVFDVPSSTSPLSIYRTDDTGHPNSEDWSGTFIFDSYEVRQSTSNIGEGFNRRIVFHSRPELIAGRYVATPRHDANNNIAAPQCNGINTLPGTVVPVADFRYDFFVAPDCDANGIDDRYQISQNPLLDIYDSNDDIHPDGMLDSCQCGTFADYNEDGNNDQGDVDYLINVIAGGGNPTGHNPDFNHDGNADQADIDALISTIAGADCP